MALIPPHRWLCRCLAPSYPTAELTFALDRPDFPWEPLLAIAHRGLVATVLYPALRRRGLLERTPVAMVEHLAALHALNLERNRLLRRELIRVAQVCNALGVEPLLLKGALALLPGQPPEIAARLLGDLDLLLPAEAVAAGQQALQDQLGYRLAYPDWHFAEHHHACPLIHPDHGVKLELHHAVLGRSLEPALPAADLWRDSQRINFEGTFVRAPAPTHRALHNALHTLLQDHGAALRRLELRQLLDLVRLRANREDAIDWPLIKARFTALGQSVALGGYLSAARNLFGQPLPDGARPSMVSTWLSGKFLLGIRYPALLRGHYWWMRLKRLPKRLGTLSWYAMKIRALRRGESL